MAEPISAFHVLKLPLKTKGPTKKATAVMLKRLIPILKKEAVLTPEQSAELVVTIHSIAKSGRKATGIEILTLAAFANSCG